MACTICGNARWVCEDHADKPWGGASDGVGACHCGAAGMPCPLCNQTVGKRPPEMPPGYRTMLDENGWKN